MPPVAVDKCGSCAHCDSHHTRDTRKSYKCPLMWAQVKGSYGGEELFFIFVAYVKLGPNLFAQFIIRELGATVAHDLQAFWHEPANKSGITSQKTCCASQHSVHQDVGCTATSRLSRGPASHESLPVPHAPCSRVHFGADTQIHEALYTGSVTETSSDCMPAALPLLCDRSSVSWIPSKENSRKQLESESRKGRPREHGT